MKKTCLIHLLVAIGFFSACLTWVNAQQFDIGLFEKDPTTLEVRIRCNQTVTGLASNIVFTIRWDNSSGTSLATAPINTYPNITFNKTPGGVLIDGGFNYQKFVHVGFQLSSWTAGTEAVVLEIAVASTTNPINPLPISGFVISEDPYTTTINGEFYVEFNALNLTGIIYHASAFPIELLSFDAEKISEHIVVVDWVTASEVNNDHFLVEKKREGGSFEVIGKVNSQGDSDEIQTYSMRDATEMAPVNYYRLKQVDTDGTFTYSHVVEIRFDHEGSKHFTVYPSPAKDVAYLKSLNQLDGNYAYYVSDLAGRIVLEGIIHEDTPNLSATLKISHLPSGSYFVRTESPNPLGKVFFNRFVKQ